MAVIQSRPPAWPDRDKVIDTSPYCRLAADRLIAALRAENARLQAENERLQAERDFLERKLANV